MSINFTVTGRLGNAIFRYMASSILSIYFNIPYSINNVQRENLSDEDFLEIINYIINGKDINPCIILKIKNGVNMNKFYQHDLIYKLYKNKIKEFINNHPSHYILTDGINAGDGKCEKFFMKDILNTPKNFNKSYNNVLHIRLEDFVDLNLYLDKERIINLLNKDIINNHLCILCKKPTTLFEYNYINCITTFLNSKNIMYNIESNDIMTDFYIMKEAEILICSMSTLSWSAAFFSDKIQKCFLPDYDIKINSTCKSPIDNTELY